MFISLTLLITSSRIRTWNLWCTSTWIWGIPLAHWATMAGYKLRGTIIKYISYKYYKILNLMTWNELIFQMHFYLPPTIFFHFFFKSVCKCNASIFLKYQTEQKCNFSIFSLLPINSDKKLKIINSIENTDLCDGWPYNMKIKTQPHILRSYAG